MNLEEYLNEYFPGPFSDEFLKEHFKSFGVYVSIESNKFLFKYDQIEVDWNNPLSAQCRGAILYYNYGEGWKYLSRPWNKFYNREEGRSGYSTDKDFEKLAGKKVVLKQKMDGSCCVCWNDPEDNLWKISTLGAITTKNVFDFNMTFEDLFYSVLLEKYNKTKQDIETHFVAGNTYIFELCTKYNQIVTEYKEHSITLLDIIKNETGESILNAN